MATGLHITDLPGDMTVEKFTETLLKKHVEDFETVKVEIKTGEKNCRAILTGIKEESIEKLLAIFRHMKINANRLENDRIKRMGAGTNVFIGALDASVTHEDLEKALSEFGTITSFKLKELKMEGKKNYAYANFSTAEEAEMCIKAMNDKELRGSVITVKYFVPAIKRQANFTNLYVKNFPVEWTATELINFFVENSVCTAEDITSTVVRESKLGEKLGKFGFCNFRTHELALAAVELHEDTEKGNLYIVKAMPKYERDIEKRRMAQKRKTELTRKYQGCNLYVKYFDENMSDDDLKAIFERYGATHSVKIARDAEGVSKKFGFCCFQSIDDANKCMANPPTVAGRKLYIAQFQTRERRAQAKAMPARVMQSHTGPREMMEMQMQNPYFMQQMMMYQQQMMQQQYYHQHQQQQQRRAPRQNMRQQQQQQPMAQAVPQQMAPVVPAMPVEKKPAQHNELIQKLGAAPQEQHNQILGEALYPLVQNLCGDHTRAPEEHKAPKITGMLLEMDQADILEFFSNSTKLQEKVNEAIEVLETHTADQ
eukprot:TRINITY_DN3098_c1_g1_i1.p2 TRINITY_DN3098_c1_g1~~TRINITY_DN3098_c1_g1_i1.p2  ORF type:complete len:541 (-),score=149.41 TRINITY_DN3098_c1_g1_i1:131-1753(-)